jgi:Sulfotransferase domain
LHRYLVEHPGIVPAFRKEIHFFDRNLHKGIRWYREHFPSALYRSYATKVLGRRFLTGEATAAYLFYPHAPTRMAETVPNAKLIVLLRNPIDRAFSQYQHEVANGYETLPFEEAIAREPERLAGERERLLADENYDGVDYRHHSYLSRGRYAEQLEVWLQHFPRQQVLVLRSEDFFADPELVLGSVLQFLGLPPASLRHYPKYNHRDYTEMTPALRRRLRDQFAPHNQRLAALLGRDFGWDG